MKKKAVTLLEKIIDFNLFILQKIFSLIYFDYNIIKKEINYLKKIIYNINKKITYFLMLFLIGSLPGKLQLIISKETNIDAIKASVFNSFMLFFYSPFPFLALIQIFFSLIRENVVNDAAKIILLIYFVQLTIRLLIITFKKIPVGFLEYETLYYIITLGKKDNYVNKTFSNTIKKVEELYKKYLKKQ